MLWLGDRASNDRASNDRASNDRASSDKASNDKALNDKALNDKALNDKALSAETEALFRALTRSVWVVTAAAGDQRGGLLASWLHGTALSAERPTAVLGLSPNSHTASLIDRSGAFAAHLLAPEQADLALHFALQSGHDGVDKLASLSTQPSLTGSPLLTDARGWIECRLAVRQDVGARVLYWCDIVAAQAPGAAALLDERQLIAAATADQRERLRADRAAAAEALHEAEQAWRERNRWTPPS